MSAPTFDGFRFGHVNDGERMVTYTVRDGSPVSRLFDVAPEMFALLSDIDARVMWMANEYAEAGGLHGPEMREYKPIQVRLKAILARIAGEQS